MLRFKMNWLRLVQISFWLIVVALAINLLYQSARKMRMQEVRAQAAGSATYTVVLRETVIDDKGKSHIGMVLTLAARSDGSRAERFGEAATGGRRIYLSSGQKITTKDNLKLKSTEKALPASAQSFDPASKCTQLIAQSPVPPNLKRVPIELIGEEVVAGFRTAKLRFGSSTTSTSWHALDYGCVIVQTRTDFGAKGSSEMHLVSLAPGEPDSSLFTLTDDFKEVPPSVLMSKAKGCGADCQATVQRDGTRLDAHYYSHRVH